MARFEFEVIHEDTGTFMNFIHETDTEDEQEAWNEVFGNLSVVCVEMIEGND